MNIQKHLKLLGMQVEDCVTGFKGVASTVSFDLYGCVQIIVTPAVDKEKGEPRDSKWFDASRLKTLSATPVMLPPNWEHEGAEVEKGPVEKPAFSTLPLTRNA